MRKITYLFALLFLPSVVFADTRYFAEVDKNNVVKRVIVAESSDVCMGILEGNWIETYKDSIGKNYAGIGDEFWENLKEFIKPQPFPSWNLDETKKWKAPKDMPQDGFAHRWNEKTQEWE